MLLKAPPNLVRPQKSRHAPCQIPFARGERVIDMFVVQPRHIRRGHRFASFEGFTEFDPQVDTAHEIFTERFGVSPEKIFRQPNREILRFEPRRISPFCILDQVVSFLLENGRWEDSRRRAATSLAFDFIRLVYAFPIR